MLEVKESIKVEVKANTPKEFGLLVKSLYTEPITIKMSGSCGCTTTPNMEYVVEPNMTVEIPYTVNRSSAYTGSLTLFKKKPTGVFELEKSITFNVSVN